MIDDTGVKWALKFGGGRLMGVKNLEKTFPGKKD